MTSTAKPGLFEQARLAQATAGPVPSPCISVCRMDEASGLCSGCLRTLGEIARWSGMSDDDRRAVWRLIERRAGSPSPLIGIDPGATP